LRQVAPSIDDTLDTDGFVHHAEKDDVMADDGQPGGRADLLTGADR
jgi:hypothetical protein